MKIYHFYQEDEILLADLVSGCSPDIDIINVPYDNHNLSFNSGLLLCVREADRLGLENICLCTNARLLNLIDGNIVKQKIAESVKLKAKILLFNTRNADTIMPVSNGYFWVDKFYDSDFIVLSKTCFPLIISDPSFEQAKLNEYLSKLTSNKLLTHPMLLNDDEERFYFMVRRMSRMAEKLMKIDQFY